MSTLGLAFRHAIRTARVRAPIPEQINPQLRGGNAGTRLAHPSSVFDSIVRSSGSEQHPAFTTDAGKIRTLLSSSLIGVASMPPRSATVEDTPTVGLTNCRPSNPYSNGVVGDTESCIMAHRLSIAGGHAGGSW